MTYQEVLWQGKFVWVVGILSRSGRMHRDLRQYVGRGGLVLGESKNGRLLIQFKGHTRGIPAGCVVEYGTVKQLWN
jgi:hypothetical protein